MPPSIVPCHGHSPFQCFITGWSRAAALVGSIAVLRFSIELANLPRGLSEVRKQEAEPALPQKTTDKSRRRRCFCFICTAACRLAFSIHGAFSQTAEGVISVPPDASERSCRSHDVHVHIVKGPEIHVSVEAINSIRPASACLVPPSLREPLHAVIGVTAA